VLYQQGFDTERHAFEKLAPELEERHGVVFVAVHQGAVVDSDPDLQTLVARFFERYDEASVYFGYVGTRQPILRVSSPLVQR
jgi:hypothetical protein